MHKRILNSEQSNIICIIKAESRLNIKKIHKLTSNNIRDSWFTLCLSHSSTEPQDNSSSGTVGSISSLVLTADDDDVRTTFISAGFFLQDCKTFSVPLTAGSRISACKNCVTLSGNQDSIWFLWIF